MKFGEDFLEELKARVRPSDVVGRDIKSRHWQWRRALCVLAAGSLLLSGTMGVANANGQTLPNLSASNISVAEQFVPKPSSDFQIDYENWSVILQQAVLFMGPSARIKAETKFARAGSLLPFRVDTPYRLEGNKVIYPYFKPAMSDAIRIYVDEFIAMANRVDITTLPRDEQLAFWINLHNGVVLREIDRHYPGPKKDIFDIRPEAGGGEKLHDAPLITINGTVLSLRDIREDIVFPNWNSPDVAFAFHLGNGGGPSMRQRAYTTPGLADQIKDNASEYINALRGYDKGRINSYFYDIAPWYFPTFDADISGYFGQRMKSKVKAEFEKYGIKKTHKPDNRPADMTSGHGRDMDISARHTKHDFFQAAPGYRDSTIATYNPNSFATKFMQDRLKKIDRLKRRGEWKTGTATIEDIPAEEISP